MSENFRNDQNRNNQFQQGKDKFRDNQPSGQAGGNQMPGNPRDNQDNNRNKDNDRNK